MKITKILLAIAMLSGVLVALGRLQVAADPSDFPVIGADAVYEPPLAGGLESDLGLLVDQVSDGYMPPIASDATHWEDFAAPTGTLESLIQILPLSHSSAVGSDSTIWHEFQAPTTTLATLLDALPLSHSSAIGSDSTIWREFQVPTGTLVTLLDVLPLSHSSAIGSDSTIWRAFQSPSTVLATLLNALPQYHFPVQSSDSTYQGIMQYPKLLLNDTMPPQISNFSYEKVTGLLEFDTDEFAINEIWYGDTGGTLSDYSHVLTTTTWVTIHQVLLPDVNMEYVLVRCADRSGNISDFYSPGFSISGTVVDENGDPIPGVIISVSPTQITLTDENGTYTLGGIPAGDVVLTAYHPDYEFTPLSITVSGNLEGQDFVGQPSMSFVFLPLVLR